MNKNRQFCKITLLVLSYNLLDVFTCWKRFDFINHFKKHQGFFVFPYPELRLINASKQLSPETINRKFIDACANGYLPCIKAFLTQNTGHAIKLSQETIEQSFQQAYSTKKFDIIELIIINASKQLSPETINRTFIDACNNQDLQLVDFLFRQRVLKNITLTKESIEKGIAIARKKDAKPIIKLAQDQDDKFINALTSKNKQQALDLLAHVINVKYIFSDFLTKENIFATIFMLKHLEIDSIEPWDINFMCINRLNSLQQNHKHYYPSICQDIECIVAKYHAILKEESINSALDCLYKLQTYENFIKTINKLMNAKINKEIVQRMFVYAVSKQFFDIALKIFNEKFDSLTSPNINTALTTASLAKLENQFQWVFVNKILQHPKTNLDSERVKICLTQAVSNSKWEIVDHICFNKSSLLISDDIINALFQIVSKCSTNISSNILITGKLIILLARFMNMETYAHHKRLTTCVKFVDIINELKKCIPENNTNKEELSNCIDTTAQSSEIQKIFFRYSSEEHQEMYNSVKDDYSPTNSLKP